MPHHSSIAASSAPASAWRDLKPTLFCEIGFELHELPHAQLMDRLLAARRRLIANDPERTASIDAEFGKVEDAVAELAGA